MRFPVLLFSLVLTLAACDGQRAFAPPPAAARVERASIAATRENVAVLAPQGNVFEGSISIAPDGQNVIAAGIQIVERSQPKIVTFRSADGGVTWSAPELLPLTLPNRTLGGHFDPVVAHDRTGIAYLAVVGNTLVGHTTIAVYRSTDDGRTWTGHDVIGGRGSLNDKPWIAVDTSGGPNDGSVYLAWIDTSGSEIGGLYLSVSRDRGITWSAPRKIATRSLPFIAVGPAGRPHFFNLDWPAPGYHHFALNESAEPGPITTLDVPAAVPQQGTAFPQLAADATTGNLYAVYAKGEGASATILLARSADGGATWSRPEALSRRGSYAALPCIATDPTTGEVSVVWLEGSGPEEIMLYGTRSRDGGATFEKARPFTDPMQTTDFIGHYNQLAVRGALRLAVYSDTQGQLSVARIDFDAVPPAPPRRRAVRH